MSGSGRNKLHVLCSVSHVHGDRIKGKTGVFPVVTIDPGKPFSAKMFLHFFDGLDFGRFLTGY